MADEYKKRQKHAKQLEVIKCARQAKLQYEVYYLKDSDVSVDLENLLNVTKWLRENVGEQGVAWDLKVEIINNKDNIFIFHNEKYAAAFKLAFT